METKVEDLVKRLLALEDMVSNLMKTSVIVKDVNGDVL
jgi:hypothetical protein